MNGTIISLFNNAAADNSTKIRIDLKISSFLKLASKLKNINVSNTPITTKNTP